MEAHHDDHDLPGRLDGDPLAADAALLIRAAEALSRRRPEASADDVLVYAAGLADARRSA